MLEIFLLSLIQGITEFLPVSSSSHLILFSNFINFSEAGLTIDVSLHIGSFLAVITYFHKDIFSFIKNRDLLLKIFISSIPVILVGYILVQTNLIEELRNIKIIGWMTIIFGLVLYASDKFELKKKINNNLNYKSALFIGFFQILSLIPGVSRSGITITAARLLNFKRFDAAKFLFIISSDTRSSFSFWNSKNYFFPKLKLFCCKFVFYFIIVYFFFDNYKIFSEIYTKF